MFQFASPAWLAAFGVLAVPVVLHLWTRRPGRLVLLGSLRHLEGAPGPRAFGRRVEQWPLLALRLGVLAACVLAVAGLRLSRSLPVGGSGGTFVVALPESIADSLHFFAHPLVDSLRRAGAPIRTLGSQARSSWSDLRALDDSLPPETEILVLGNPDAQSLGAELPALTHVVRWVGIPAAPGIQPYATWTGPGDTLHRVMEQVEDHRRKRWFEPFLPSTESSITRPAPQELTAQSVTAPHLYVVTDQQDNEESWAVKAALQAAFEASYGFSREAVALEASDQVPDHPTGSVIVWLSGQSVSDDINALLISGAILLQFPANGAELPAPTGVEAIAADWPVATIAVKVQRAARLEHGAALLIDGHGEPFLTVERHGLGRWYRLASRLDPAWSDLAAGGALPELMLYLLSNNQWPVGRAPVHPAQAQPLRVAAAASRAAPTPLHSALFLLALLLLAGERLMAHMGSRREQ